MLWYEYLIIGLAAAFVLGVIVFTVLRKKQGKSGCGCDCGCCGGSCSSCKQKEGRENK